MEQKMVKYPIGIQSFSKLREEGFAYVDKSMYVWKLVNDSGIYFLSRPRRFGKSLFLSTLESYFLGRKELFAGLEIARYEKEWKKYPVLHLDLNVANYDSVGVLNSVLNDQLAQWERLYGKEETEDVLTLRFRGIIRRAHEKTGAKVVVLIDEYDKPLLSAIGKQELYNAYKDILKGFYGTLKSSDEHLKFVFLTGVTKFGQVSVFSDLNQLQDISMLPEYASICGITRQELEINFQKGINKLAVTNGQTYDETIAYLERRYDGYHFSINSPGVYNPFSTLSVLHSSFYSDYWFQTGTPTFLMELIKHSGYDIRNLEGVRLPSRSFSDYRADVSAPVPVIYQSGYLTIKGYNPENELYTLGYPNQEVKRGFLEFMVPYYTGIKSGSGEFNAFAFVEDLRAGKVDDFMTRLKACFESIPYDMNIDNERYYQTIFYLVFRLMGIFTESELESANGRADAVVKTPGYVYVFEFKLHDSAESALKQIDDKGYLIPFTAPTSGTSLIKVGVGFSQEKKNIDRWLVEQVG